MQLVNRPTTCSSLLLSLLQHANAIGVRSETNFNDNTNDSHYISGVASQSLTRPVGHVNRS